MGGALIEGFIFIAVFKEGRSGREAKSRPATKSLHGYRETREHESYSEKELNL
jgi:hypothetical protein